MILNTNTNTQIEKEHNNKIDLDDPIYTFIFEKKNSFIVCFNKSYYNRHNQISFPVKAISFNKTLQYNLNSLIKQSLKQNMPLKFIFVFNGFKPFPHDFGYNMYYRDGYFIFMNVMHTQN
jgi:hypothetical protein